MNPNLKRMLAPMLAWGALGMGQALAAPTVYTDLTAWTTAAGGSSAVEDFSSSTAVSPFSSTLIPGFSIKFGTFLPGSVGGGVYTDEGVSLTTNNPLLSFAPGVLGFGADWDLGSDAAAGPGGGLLLQLTYSDATTDNLVVPDTLTGQFWGFTSTKAVSSILVNAIDFSSEETFIMDNARIPGENNNGGGGGTAPEPGMLALLGISAAALALRRRRTE